MEMRLLSLLAKTVPLRALLDAYAEFFYVRAATTRRCG